MEKILGIETSSKVCSIALKLDNDYKEINLDLGLTHCETLFFNLNNLLIDNKVDVKDLDYIAVSNGPGSYTGLRIGVSCAIGLSKAYNTKIAYVDTLFSLFYNIYDYEKDNKLKIFDDDIICAMLDAKANRVYFSMTRYADINYKINEEIITIDEFVDRILKIDNDKTIYLLGDGSILYRDEIINNYDKNIVFVDDKYSMLNAKNIIKSSKNIENVACKLNINYIQKSQAERNRLKQCLNC